MVRKRYLRFQHQWHGSGFKVFLGSYLPICTSLVSCMQLWLGNSFAFVLFLRTKWWETYFFILFYTFCSVCRTYCSVCRLLIEDQMYPHVPLQTWIQIQNGKLEILLIKSYLIIVVDKKNVQVKRVMFTFKIQVVFQPNTLFPVQKKGQTTTAKTPFVLITLNALGSHWGLSYCLHTWIACHDLNETSKWESDAPVAFKE